MKPLKDVCPDPKEVLDVEPEQLAPHVLHCLSDTNEPNIRRAIIARHLADDYHESLRHEIAHAIQEALQWLFAQCLVGASPYDQDLIFLTRRGKKVASDYKEELAGKKK
jgi:hypothetical protein